MDAGGIRGVADRVVPPTEQVDVEELVLGELGEELFVQIVAHGGVVVERVGGTKEELVASFGPALVVRVAVRDRGDLRSVEADTVGEEGDVDAPFVLAAAAGARAPQPGRAVRGSTTGRPLMAALDLLGRRWALRLLWELRAEPLGARNLRDRCDGMSSSVLYERLGELIGAGLIEKNGNGDYTLTPLGTDLGSALLPLDDWSQRWARQQHAR